MTFPFVLLVYLFYKRCYDNTSVFICDIPLHYGSTVHTICFSQTQLYVYLDYRVYVSINVRIFDFV